MFFVEFHMLISTNSTSIVLIGEHSRICSGLKNQRDSFDNKIRNQIKLRILKKVQN